MAWGTQEAAGRPVGHLAHYYGDASPCKGIIPRPATDSPLGLEWDLGFFKKSVPDLISFLSHLRGVELRVTGTDLV